MTMMRILERKGHVKVSRADRAYVYRPACARQRVVGEMVREFSIGRSVPRYMFFAA